MSRMHKKAGFTLIETSLATLFLGIIVLAVANLIVQMTRIYQKGLAMRAINSSGQQIIEDMQREIGSATNLFDIDGDKNGLITNDEIIQGRNKYFKEWNKGSSEQKQVAGAFCVGSHSYVWNTAIPLEYGDGTNSGLYIKYNYKTKTGTATATKRFRLGRIYDPGHLICSDAKWTPPSGAFAQGRRLQIDLSGSGAIDEPVELINKDESDIAVYDFTIHPITQSTITKQSFVSASFILATVRGGVNIMSDSDYCQGKAASSGDMNDYDDHDFEYCAVNKFNFSMRTGGNANKKG